MTRIPQEHPPIAERVLDYGVALQFCPFEDVVANRRITGDFDAGLWMCERIPAERVSELLSLLAPEGVIVAITAKEFSQCDDFLEEPNYGIKFHTEKFHDVCRCFSPISFLRGRSMISGTLLTTRTLHWSFQRRMPTSQKSSQLLNERTDMELHTLSEAIHA